MIENRPANVPQQYANQAAHARYALHARIFLLGGFVSIENKERLSYFPKPEVVSVHIPSGGWSGFLRRYPKYCIKTNARLNSRAKAFGSLPLAASRVHVRLSAC